MRQKLPHINFLSSRNLYFLSVQEAKALPGIGEKLAEKIWEIIESGELRKLDELTGQEEVQALKLFTNIWGAGTTTARTWVQAGFRTLDDIRFVYFFPTYRFHFSRDQVLI